MNRELQQTSDTLSKLWWLCFSDQSWYFWVLLPEAANIHGFAAVFTACVDTFPQFVIPSGKYRTLQTLPIPTYNYHQNGLSSTATHNYGESEMTVQLIRHIYAPTCIDAYLTCIYDSVCFLLIQHISTRLSTFFLPQHCLWFSCSYCLHAV